MTPKLKDKLLTAIYMLGAVILGVLGAFTLWAILWIYYSAGFEM